MMNAVLFFVALTVGAVEIGFKSEADLFTGGPAEHIRLVDGTMHWQVARSCAKSLSPGALSGTARMRARFRASGEMKLWLQLNEASGERYYAIVDLSREWNEVTLALADFALNADSAKDGTLDMSAVDRIVMVHVGEGSKRQIWLADWQFEAAPEPVARPDFVRPVKTGKVGMVCTPRDFRETDAHWQDLFEIANSAGAQLLSLQAGIWQSKNGKDSVYDFGSWDRFFNSLDRHGFHFEMSKDMGEPFFLEKLNLPPGLEFRGFDDPELVGRYIDFITAYLDRSGKRHRYIVIHAEGSSRYFPKHPDHVGPYCRFLGLVRRAILRHSPHLSVGVNCDISTDDATLRRFVAQLDFIAFDILKGKIVRKPADFATLIERLLKVAGDKPIAIQNVGWSTSRTDNASETDQVAFIREYFRVVALHRARIEYASFGAVYDHDTAIMGPAYQALFPDLPKQAVARITDSMSNFGLFRVDGSEKPGWAEYLKQVRQYYSE